jgi:dynein heavy chain
MMQLLRSNYNMIANEDEATRAVGYAITLFHAIISDRAKFGPVGWNVPYQYTEMEYQNSLRILKEVVSRASNPNCIKCNIDEIDEIQDPLDFEALRNLIGGINYEGRITDELDRAKLKVLTESFLTADLLTSDFKFMGLKAHSMPKGFTFEEMMEHIEEIKEDPSIFGLNAAQQPSANIST